MSEFFNVTLERGVILDDSTISNKTGWTSEKIYRAIVEKRITKFEELEDVDVSNKKDKQIVAWSADTQKFTTVDGISAGEIIGNGLKQITKMGVVGSKEEPRIINIPVNTLDFKVFPVTVLRYSDEMKNMKAIKSDFTNGEANDFYEDNEIMFDGKAHLKTEYYKKFDLTKELNTKYQYLVPIKDFKFKEIVRFDQEEDGVAKILKTTAIPHDKLLIPRGDMNLSNVRRIKSFNLTGEGKNIRIICSADGGQTWKTFRGEQWQDINLDIEDVKRNGMTIELFNNINDIFWNELITSKRIRFAYLLSMDNIDDIEELDKIELIYDGDGVWEQVNPNMFKAVYVSNTLLKVYLYFSGDVKINY